MTDNNYNRMLEIMGIFKKDGIRQSGKNLNLVIDFQDIIGHATNDEIADAWLKLDANQKSIFIWSVSCCMSMESMVMVVEATMGRDAKRKLFKQYENEYADIEQQQLEVANQRLTLEKREKELDATVKAQTDIQNILNNLRG